ncbi:MAG: hypothetical protein AB8B50_05735 [Pirellulaceae bacterium]
MVNEFTQRTSSTVSTFAILALCFTLSFSFCSKSYAGGWPPYGAWAYGSGWPAGGAVRSRSVYRGYPFGGASYRSRTVYRGGYGLRYSWPSYSAYRGASVYRSSYAWPSVYRSRYRVAYGPVLAAPVYYSPWIVAAPISYRTSFFTTSSCWPTSTYLHSSYLWPTYTQPLVTPIYAAPITPTPTTIWTPACVLSSPGTPPGINVSSPLVHRAARAAPDTSLTIASATQTRDVPSELLSAADAILRVGGYRDAAKAYAELSLRYGTSEDLLARRFVANVLNHDFRQAEVIAELSELLGFDLDKRSLNGQPLSEFVGESVRVEVLTEKLAELALRDRNNLGSLRSVATWLSLDNDLERSALFFTAASGGPNAAPGTNLDSTTFVARVESE